MIRCVCCGQPVPSPPQLSELSRLPLSPSHQTVLRQLVRSYPEARTAEELITALYSGARLPEWPRNQLRSIVAVIRRELGPHGWTVERRGGGRVSYYSLRRAENDRIEEDAAAHGGSTEESPVEGSRRSAAG